MIFELGWNALVSMFKKPVTLMYPVIKRDFVKGARGQLVIDLPSCIYCGMCQRKCPTQALTVTRKKNTKPGETEDTTPNTWQINRLRCISCGACVEICPKNCLVLSTQYTAPTTEQKIEVYKI